MLSCVHLFPSATTLLCFSGQLDLLTSRHGATVWQACDEDTFNRPNVTVLRSGRPVLHYLHQEDSFLAIANGLLVFRVLFTLHQDTLLPSVTVEDGLLNCSGDHFQSFALHVLCNWRQECVGEEDELDCPYTLCLHSGIMVDDHCYVLVKREEGRLADYQCSSVAEGGHLARLDTPWKWSMVLGLLQLPRYLARAGTVGTDLLAVALRSVPRQFPHMYKQMLHWEGGSIAYFGKIFTGTEKAIYHAVTHSGNIARRQFHSQDLAIKLAPGPRHTDRLLCEVPMSLSDTAQNVEISLNNVTTSTHQRFNATYFVCPKGHYTQKFLACDAQSHCWASVDVTELSTARHSWGVLSGSTCSVPMTSLPVYFWCAGGVDYVSYSSVCDYQKDCFDASDEDFCRFPPCPSFYFQCNNKQCLDSSLLCDYIGHCLDDSDELMCPSPPHGVDPYTQLLPRATTTPPPAVIHFTGRGGFTVTPLNHNSQCPDTHFQCPEGGYCLPVYVRCNGIDDCTGKEDEMGCEAYTCPGFYRCQGSSPGTVLCVHAASLCDGWAQCPRHDDELFCQLLCPSYCTCHGHAFICDTAFSVHLYPGLRYLNAAGSRLKPGDLLNNSLLVHLSLADCEVMNLTNLPWPNLNSLDLSYNQIMNISSNDLKTLINLRFLFLVGNPLKWCIPVSSETAFLYKLRVLDMSKVTSPQLDVSFLALLPNLTSLNLTDSSVVKIFGKGFQALRSLQTLDLRGNALPEFPKDMLSSLTSLQQLYSDNYKLCCPAMWPVGLHLKRCVAPFDEISSCVALLRSEAYRVGLAVLASMTLLGNLASFLFRVAVYRGGKKTGNSVFVIHLCVSDFLMGVYLVIVRVADHRFQGSYLWKDVTWKHSTACHTAGFVSLLSSEVSALVICLITLDRFIVLRFPFSQFHFKSFSAQVVSVGTWISGAIVAGVPLLPWLSHWLFYSHTGICNPLPVTRNTFAGRHYAFGVMIIFNFVLFVMIAAGQLAIYLSIHASRLTAERPSTSSQDLDIAKRLLVIVASDFLCWFPVGLLGLLASSGVPIPGELNVAMAIFVLPLNSALNPFLYTLNMIKERRHRAREKRLLQHITS